MELATYEHSFGNEYLTFDEIWEFWLRFDSHVSPVDTTSEFSVACHLEVKIYF